MNCSLLNTEGASVNELLTKSKDRMSNGEGATSLFNAKGTTIAELLFKINNIQIDYTKNSKKKVSSVGTKSCVIIKAKDSVLKLKFTKKGNWGGHTQETQQVGNAQNFDQVEDLGGTQELSNNRRSCYWFNLPRSCPNQGQETRKEEF